MISNICHWIFSLLLATVALTGCATLPDTEALIQRHNTQAANFENARGPVSAKRSAAIFAELKRRSGDLDILDKQMALEQAISDSPLTLGNKVTLLQDGSATYAAMFAAIARAKDHINLESYIIEDDAIGHEFATLLLAARARGVQVNMVYDSVGGFNTPKAFFERLTQAGIAVLEFNPVNPLQAKGAWLINNRDHRKLLIVDGRTVFLGGINISNVYSSGSVVRRPGKPDESAVAWRDTDLQIEGPVVAEFQKMFIETWRKQHGPTLAEKTYFPGLTAQGKDIVRAIASTPDDPYSLIYLTLISAIGNAEKHVHLTNAYFVPDPQLLTALTGAAARGVEVKLVLPSHSDSQLVFHAGRAHYAGLLKGGVQIFELQGELLHSKTAVIDGVWSTVGSTNLDWRSFLHNQEVNAVVLGTEFGDRMRAAFESDVAQSEQITLEQWRRRSGVLHLKEAFARLWQYWL